MPIVFLTVALQVIAVVHLFRTGRNMTWLFLIILVPMVGPIAYFIVEVLPSLGQNPAARKALRRAKRAIDPGRGLREGSLNYERSQNVDTAIGLAAELSKAGRHDEAIRVCTEARTGLFEDDPKILLATSKAQFAAGASRSPRFDARMFTAANTDQVANVIPILPRSDARRSVVGISSERVETGNVLPTPSGPESSSVKPEWWRRFGRGADRRPSTVLATPGV